MMTVVKCNVASGNIKDVKVGKNVYMYKYNKDKKEK